MSKYGKTTGRNIGENEIGETRTETNIIDSYIAEMNDYRDVDC
jgi:hypothetical protein